MRRLFLVLALLLPGTGRAADTQTTHPAVAHPDPRHPTPCPASGTSYAPPCISSTWSGWTGLVGYWSLDETSGTRYSSVGSYNLTDNNTVGYVAGKNGNAANLVVSNSEYLSRAANVIDTEHDFTIAVWLRLSGGTGDRSFNPWQTATGSKPGLNVELEWAGFHRSYTRCGYGTSVEIGNNVGNWVLYIFEYVAATTTGRVMALGSVTNSGVWSTNDVSDLADDASFYLGLVGTAGVVADMDEVALWNRVLTAAERSDLYNGGAGKFYPF